MSDISITVKGHTLPVQLDWEGNLYVDYQGVTVTASDIKKLRAAAAKQLGVVMTVSIPVMRYVLLSPFRTKGDGDEYTWQEGELIGKTGNGSLRIRWKGLGGKWGKAEHDYGYGGCKILRKLTKSEQCRYVALNKAEQVATDKFDSYQKELSLENDAIVQLITEQIAKVVADLDTEELMKGMESLGMKKGG